MPKTRNKYLLAILLAVITAYSAIAQSMHIQKVRLNLPSGEQGFNTAIQDRSGFLWLGSDHGLYRFDGRSIDEYFPKEDSLEFKVLSIHENPEGELWIGCRNGSIFKMNGNGLSLFNPEEGTAGTGISDIVTDPQGVTWWSTLGEGIYYYSNGHVYNINHEDGLKEDYVYDLHVDGEGKIWAGTDGGVAICSLVNGQKMVEIPDWNSDLPDPIVKVLRADNAGNIYLGFYESLPGYILNGTYDFVDLSSDPAWPYDAISDVAVVEDGIWISTSSGKLFEMGKTGLTEIHSGTGNGQPVEKFGKINRLLEDREGNLWVVASAGLFRTTGSKWKFYDHVQNTSLHNIHAIYHDPGDELLVQQ